MEASKIKQLPDDQLIQEDEVIEVVADTRTLNIRHPKFPFVIRRVIGEEASNNVLSEHFWSSFSNISSNCKHMMAYGKMSFGVGHNQNDALNYSYNQIGSIDNRISKKDFITDSCSFDLDSTAGKADATYYVLVTVLRQKHM